MKRFSISKNLRERFRAPTPLEVEHPPPLPPSRARKWFLRIVSFFIFIGILIVLFREFFTYRFTGIIESDKSVIYSTISGKFESYVKVGNKVEKGKVIGIIKNPSREKEIEALIQKIKKLEKIKKKISKEGTRKAKQDKILVTLRVNSPQSIKKEISILKNRLNQIEKEERELESRLNKVKKLLNKGYATLYDINLLRNNLKNLVKEKERIQIELTAKEEELKKATYLSKTGTPPNPFLPLITSIDTQIEQTKAQLERLKSESVQLIKAPFPAKVSFVFPSCSTINTGEKVVELIKENSYKVIVYIPSKVLTEVKLGDEALVKLPSGKILKGNIVKINPNLKLKPPFLVGPLEKRGLHGEIEIKLKEKGNELYENLPVTVYIPKLKLKLFRSSS